MRLTLLELLEATGGGEIGGTQGGNTFDTYHTDSREVVQGGVFVGLPLGEAAMSIGLAASQREKHASLHHLAGVGGERVERISDLGAAELATAGRLEEVEGG